MELGEVPEQKCKVSPSYPEPGPPDKANTHGLNLQSMMLTTTPLRRNTAYGTFVSMHHSEQEDEAFHRRAAGRGSGTGSVALKAAPTLPVAVCFLGRV